MRSSVCFGVLLATAACTGPTNFCAQVKCGLGKVCNPLNGLCIAGDGGPVTTTDAGNDGGTDAGELDAGSDGGSDGGLSCSGCSTAQQCDVATGQCVACLSNANCTCPAPVCNLTRHSCEFPPYFDGGLGLVDPAPAPGESCAAPGPLPFIGCDPRRISFRIDLAPRSDDDFGVCSAPGGNGRDVVYRLSLEKPYDVTVRAIPAPGSLAEPVVYLRRIADSGVLPGACYFAPDLACTDGAGGDATLRVKSRQPGEYAVFIDTYDAAAGGLVDVIITLEAPTTPANESCLTAEVLPVDGGVTRVDLALATDDEPTSCNPGGLDSADVVWRFDLEATSDVIAVARGLGNPDAGLSPIVELRPASCVSADRVACHASAGNGPVYFRARSLPAGTYFAVLEGYDRASSGPIDFSLTATPPSPPLQYDTCAAPRDIVFPDGGTFTEWDIDTSMASDDEEGSCNSLVGGPEFVYHLRLNSARRVTITAYATGLQTLPGDAGTSGGSGADAVIYLRSGTCGGSELGCADDWFADKVESLSSGTTYLTSGDYYLFVESWGDSVGSTHVTVSALP